MDKNKNDMIYVGKIVNTHGIRGEVRLLSNFKYKNKVFNNGIEIYIGKDRVKEIIKSYRKHKCFDMLTFMGYDNINDVLKYKGALCYVMRSSLNLDKQEFLDEDLSGLDVIIENEVCGKVIKLEKMSDKNSVLWIMYNGKQVAVPFVSDFVNVNLDEGNVEVKPIEGLF